ncbi:MAG: hypothetical protein IJ764_00425 [Bacteroidales bacterium]|nr:hypothetical protein [Bacteroidales bacterium]
MNYSVSDIMRDVRITLDQNNVSETLVSLGDIDTLTLEQIIESKIEVAARTVESTAPNVMLDSGKAFANRSTPHQKLVYGETISEGVVYWVSEHGRGSGRILLPSDFLRLVTFKMSDWEYGVTSLVREGDALYSRQFSRYPGLRGNIQRPVVTMRNQIEGLVLEFFSCDAGDSVTVEKAQYIAIPKIRDGNIDLCERLRPAVVYYIACLVAQSTGDNALSESMQATCKQLMEMA